jgi:DNA-binding NarL/FixJ family response regulator
MQVNLEEFSTAVAAIHAAAAFPERWPEAVTAVARLVNASEAAVVGHINWEDACEIKPPPQQAAAPAEPSVRQVMSLLAPHLAAARQVRKRLAEASRGQLALAGLDRLAVAAFIVDGGGAVQHCNRWARTVVEVERCCRIAHGRLRLNEPALNSALETSLRRATEPRARSSLLPLYCANKEIFELTVSPLGADYALSGSRRVPLALVTIARPRGDGRRIMQRVRRLYGLTDAEARVVSALALGSSVDEIAAAHGVQPSTVRAQVRSIFDKMGVNRQTDLVRLALTGAPIVDGPES